MANQQPPPYHDPVIITSRGEFFGWVQDKWENWLLIFTTRVNQMPEQFQQVVTVPNDTDLGNASIGTTPIPLPSLATGLYRVNVYLRVTQAASVSSSILVTISATDGGVPAPQSTGAITSNSISTPLSQVFIVAADQATPINYATTYGSVGTAMTYKVEITVESLPSN